MLNALEVTGRARTHVVQFDAPTFAAQAEVADAFLQMRSAAAVEGIDLRPVSSFRDFRMQLRIWNQKFLGKKPLYDITGQTRDYGALTPFEIVQSILNWSALPGGSRHQWGTEIDVVDAAATPADYAPKLLPEEVAPGGVFHPLHRWLDGNIARFGFFRPYNYDRGGMYPEPWHLSYAPASTQAIKALDVALLREVLVGAEMAGKELVLAHLDALFEGHVLNFVPPDKQRPVAAP